MENHESQDTELLEPCMSGGSLDNLQQNEAPSSSSSVEADNVNTSLALLDDALKNTSKNVTPTVSDKEPQQHTATTSKHYTKDSGEAHKSKSFFHFSDNLKKDLSLLAFPSKSISRKKGITSSRAVNTARITIAEALEKAKDARESMTSMQVTSGKPNISQSYASPSSSQTSLCSSIADQREPECGDMIGQLYADTSDTSGGRGSEMRLDPSETNEIVADVSVVSDATLSDNASYSEGKSMLVGGKSKSGGSARVELTRRMWELLKFTFNHEHFPSSVHMARLAKMMGRPWSQVRNWFTDRRVDNKKAGIFPRDRPLTDCHYCNVKLETEAEQKGHLFSTHHVKKILGPEYCGGASAESIKWKKLPKTVNAVSKVSGARILAVGFSSEEHKAKKAEEKEMQTAVEKPPHSKELKKLWTNAMLHPEEKKQSAAEWNQVDKSLDNHREVYLQGEKEVPLHLKVIQKESVSAVSHHENVYGGQMIVNDKFVSVPLDAGDRIPSRVSGKFVRVNSNSSVGSKVVAGTSRDPDPVTPGVSTFIPQDSHVKRSYQTEDASSMSRFELPKEVKQFAKKMKTAGMFESPTGFQSSAAGPFEVSQKVFKRNVPGNVNNSKTSTSLESELMALTEGSSKDKFSKFTTSSSQYSEFKQRSESSESWQSNATMYKDEGTSVRKVELPPVNPNRQSFTIDHNNSPFSSLTSVNTLHQNKTSTQGHEASTLSKTSRASVDRRKVKARNQPLGSVLRANRSASLAYEGNIIVGYQCPTCNKIYQTEWLMMKHCVTHWKYHCDICYKVYPTENMMKVHLLDHLSGAYEDEKYYCQFSCKVCHSLKCGCYEPTYCKPQAMPRIFVRPQKAKRSKKGFISKPNSGPNDHLKISLSSYKKLLLFENLGKSKKILDPQTTSRQPPQPALVEDSHKVLVMNDEKKLVSVGKSQISTSVVREARPDGMVKEATFPKILKVQREKPECITVEETSPAIVPKERVADSIAGVSGSITGVSGVLDSITTISDSIAGVSGASGTVASVSSVSDSVTGVSGANAGLSGSIVGVSGSIPGVSGSVAGVSGVQTQVHTAVNPFEKKLITVKDKHWIVKPIKRKLGISSKSNEIPPPGSSCVTLSEESTQDAPGIKKGGYKRKTKANKQSNFAYDDSGFYYMCEMCDANFSSKAELSEHMFFHRLKLRIRRGEKRGLPFEIQGKIDPKKMKLHASPGTKTKEEEIPMCEKCACTFPTMADYHTHTLLAHKPSTSQNNEVYRCNYCDKNYRRRRELKRHLKRDCASVPRSVKEQISANEIDEIHYTTVKLDFEDKSDVTTKSISKGGNRGPIVCKYCSAMTKREAEMKRHIWKFCLKVPSAVVRKFMDGTSLEDLGFKFLNSDANTESLPKEEPQDMDTEISGTPSDVQDQVDEIQTVQSTTEFKEDSSPEKSTPQHLKTSVDSELPESSPRSPDAQISLVQENKSTDSNNILKKTLTIRQDLFEDSNATETSSETETCMANMATPSLQEETNVQPSQSEPQEGVSTIPAEETKKPEEHCESAEEESPTKSSPEKTKMDSSLDGDSEATPPASSTRPLANLLMQIPSVLPVTTTKAKRPLVCGYCGIWYFREMAILKHMKERCIKIPPFEKELLKENNALCNVSQKPGGDPESDNGAMYKMVKVPEHMQNTPVPMPKDVSNEDIKELNANIKVYGEATSMETKPSQEEQNPPVQVSPPVNENKANPTKRGSRCRRCHEHFSSQEAVLAHSSVHHGPKKGFYKCKLCHARMVKYKQLREHVWEHTNENPYRCHLCGVKYRSSDLLVEHLLTIHQYTSINEKNLYKWLPGRHGKYREIKVKQTNCEEKLDDVDTNLESLAEVMVITDQDICSKESENKTTESKEKLDGSDMKEESESVEAESSSDVNPTDKQHKSNETKAPTHMHVTKTKDCNDDSSEDRIAPETDSAVEGGGNISTENSGTSPLNTTMEEENVGKEGETSDNLPQSEGDTDGFTGEGLLPLVENLDSVVETIQLTDRHLS